MEVIETSEEQFYCSDDAPNERKDEPKAPCIDDFEFIKPISKGAFGKVFLGHKRGKPDQLYAIKAMKKSHMINKNLTHQVVTERDAMAKLMSPFVVQLYYSFQSQQNIFLVMEYLIGGDMKSLLNVAGFFDPPMALMYVAEVTLALEYLHSKKIIHRDIKPDNMLITATGHLKLTDFGLSKCNMAFNSMDVPMTPKTPMPYSQKLDMYRTPGQVLSLRSSLAFSTEKNQPLDGSTPHSHDGHIISPLTDISNISNDRRSIGHVTPVGVKLNKQKSMRDLLLSQSTSKYMNQSGSRTFRGVTTPGRPGTSPKPPIKRLTSTLQESLNWTKSTNSQVEPSHVSDMTSPVNTDPTCGMSLTDSPDPLRTDSVMSISHASNDCDGTSDYLSDDVFLSMNSTNNQNSGHLADHSDITGTHSNLCDTCQCKKQKTADTSCNECCSHLKAPSRQEKMTDDTPQMHRSNESVWNSYAAKNLRSLRHGSYSEDNDEDVDSDSKDGLGDVFSHNSPQRPNMPDIFQARSDLKPKSIRARPRRLMKTKSFCYPSDDESDAEDRHREVMKMGKKRNFSHVEQSPIRRTHSADSGLTQEIRLLGMEPCAKRSNSVPRTRIRFHSGNDSRKTDKSLPLQPNRLKDCTESLSKIIYKCKSISDMDKMLLLSADEHRLVEGHSDTSLTSESDCKGHTTKGQGSNCTNVSGTCLVSPDPLSGSHIVEQRKDSYCSGHNTSLKLQPENEVVLTGAPEMVGPMNKRIMGMKQKMVSSVQSESDLHTHIDTNVSSIYDSDGNRSLPTYIGESVAKSKSSPSPSKAVVVPSTPNPKPAALLPPPPPKTRHPSGKTTPARLRFCSTTTSIPPSAHFHSHDYSGYSDVCATPEPSRRGMFFTPGVTIPKTPKTPHQKMLVRSQSFCHAMKTPYRTPKLDRRAPVQEEERILGTPDYLAPEILQQKPHGPEVDWWALGVCMFEFLTGVPPFNDQTPDLVFKNILERDIPWPEGDEALPEECQEAIEALLTVDPKHRPGARAVRKMAAFKEIDWHNILDVTPPFIPQPDSMTDTAYFEARNMMQGLFVSDVDLH